MKDKRTYRQPRTELHAAWSDLLQVVQGTTTQDDWADANRTSFAHDESDWADGSPVGTSTLWDD